MFSIPQPNTTITELPIIDLAEDAETILKLLLHIYPPRKTRRAIEDLTLAEKTVAAAAKYEITISDLSVDELLSDDKILRSSPAQAYALAWKLRKGTLAVNASRYTHEIDVAFNETERVAIVQGAGSPSALIALLDLRILRQEYITNIFHAIPLESYVCAHVLETDSSGEKARSAGFRMRGHLERIFQKPSLHYDLADVFTWSHCFCCNGYRNRGKPLSAAAFSTLNMKLKDIPSSIVWYVNIPHISYCSLSAILGILEIDTSWRVSFGWTKQLESFQMRCFQLLVCAKYMHHSCILGKSKHVSIT